MQFHFLLLFCTQSVTSVVTSGLSSNIWDRNPDVAHYSVYPVDPTQTNQTTQIETLLKNLCGDTNVVPVRHVDEQHDHEIDSWSITAKDNSDLIKAINALEGVRLVKQNDPSGNPFIDSEHGKLARRDLSRYLAFAKNTSDVQKTEEFLKSQNPSGTILYQYKSDGKIIFWYNLYLSPEAKEAVQKHEGIDRVSDEPKLVYNRALPASAHLLPLTHTYEMPEKNSKLYRRSGKWVKQEKADKALVMDSQFPGSDIDKLSDFVRVPNPGKGIFVYVLDAGIQIKVKNPDGEREFTTDNDIVLQTKESKDRNERDDTDDGPKDSHGTAVASKAVGKKYGLAKEATLISAKFTPHAGGGDYLVALKMILDDIKAHPGRELRSVVTTAVNMGESLTHNIIGQDQGWQDLLDPIKSLLNLGVPFVCTAGNKVKSSTRQAIDEFPPVAQDDDTPLINVGAATYSGERAELSQYGNQLTIYAPGVDIEYQTKGDGKGGRDTGTSFAGPQVAGLIATYMSMDNKPWDDNLRGLERVKAIRNYLVSKDSSFVTKPGSGINIIWNGAKEEDHKNAGANGLSNPPPPPPPPALKTKALSIILQQYIDEVSNEMTWLFFPTKQGVSVLCKNDKDAVLKTKAAKDTDVDNPPWPGGIFKLKIDGMDCEYKNDGTDAGALWCKERNGQPISCQADSMRWDKKSKLCDLGLWSISQHAVAFCEW